MFFERLASGMHQCISLITRFSQFTDLVVFCRIQLSVLDHPLDFFLRKTGVCFDGDGIFLAGCLVFRTDMQNAVGIDIEGHFNLRHTTRRSRDTFKVEFTQSLVAGGHFPFTLINLDRDRRLIIFRCREYLAELRRNRRVFLDHLGHHTAQGFNTQ